MRVNNNRRNTCCMMMVTALLGWLASPVQATPITAYEEHFNVPPWTAGPIDTPASDFGWDNVINDGVDVTAGGVVIGDNSDGSSGNASLFTIPAAALTVTIEAMARARTGTGFQTLFTVLDDSPLGNLFYFGSNPTGYRIRRANGTDFFNSNPVLGDDSLTTAHRFFTWRFTYDFATDTGSFQSSRLVSDTGDGLFSTVTTFTAADLGWAGGLTPDQFRGLDVRLLSTADQADDLVVSYTIPEPSSMMLVAIGIGGLLPLRRGRRNG